ncbi:MAG: CHAP domain-containing protein [Polyangiaceae bacterium]|nr:CHAP domain-containing protein [Polyangiaceae bacterium]
MLDLARDTGIPVDSIATTIEHESHWNPQALYEAPDNAARIAAGQAPFYAAGLCQVTPSARLPGFGSPEAVKGIAAMSAAQQMAEVVRPLWFRARNEPHVRGAHPGMALLKNFMPQFAGNPDDFVIAEKTGIRKPIFAANRPFDRNKDNTITIGEVYDAAEAVCATARGRIDEDGNRVEANRSATALSFETIAVARLLLGVGETGPNTGPQIDEWARELGLEPPLQWCAAFVSHCFRTAAKRISVAAPVRGSAHAKSLMAQFEAIGRAGSAAVARASALPAGSLLFWDRSDPPGSGPQGHVGIVESDEGALWWTIEGNTVENDVRRVLRPKDDPRLIGMALL